MSGGAEWLNCPTQREAEELELVARIERAGYLDTAPVPVDFTDIGDYLDDCPAQTVADRSERARRANPPGSPRRNSPWKWGRARARPSRDEWTP